MVKFPELQEHISIFENDESYIEYFNRLARTTLRADPVYEKDLMEYLLTISEERNYSIGKAWCLNWLGFNYLDGADFYKAAELHNESNKIFTELDYTKGIIATCNSLLSDYLLLGMYDISIEWGLLGMSIAEKEMDYEVLPVIIGNTGIAYVHLHYYSEAKELFEQLLLLPYEVSPINRGIWYQAMADIELHLDDLTQACFYIEKCTKIAIDEKYDPLLSEILYISAEVKAKQGRDKEAIEDFEKALEISQKSDDYQIISIVLIKWSNYQISVKDYDGALSNLLKARDAAEQIKSKPYLL